MTGVKLRILDAAGKALVSGKAVAATGAFGPETLTGTGPFRLEACGYAAEKLRCLYALTPLGGTSNITPLTSAVAVLASNLTPETLMATASLAAGVDASAISSAQTRLRTAIAPALTDAGLGASMDFASEPVTPGSRSGHDRLLDNLAISWGLGSSNAFVQIVPRLGTGNVYLESSSTQGQLSIAVGAATLNLADIDTLFASMNTAYSGTVTSCRASLPGLLATGARLTFDEGASLTGSQTFVEASSGDMSNFSCQWFLGPLSSGWIGASGKLRAPELGQCDFSNSTTPVCRVSAVVQNAQGDIKRLANNQGVVLQAGSWKYLGDLLPSVSQAQSRAQLIRRVNGTTPVDSYTRAISISIPTQSGLACAQVTQKNSAGLDQTLAFFKPAASATWLSVWANSANDPLPSNSPTVGATRAADERWISLNGGADGDAIVDNFYRYGRNLKISFFGDVACSTPFTPAGASGSTASIELPAVPPLSSALPFLPWPNLAAATTTALPTLKGAAAAKVLLAASWSYKGSPQGMLSALLCTNVNCSGNGSAFELALAPNASSAALSLTLGSQALAVADFKQLRLLGRGEDGLLLGADYQSCSADTAGQSCSVNAQRNAFSAQPRRSRSR